MKMLQVATLSCYASLFLYLLIQAPELASLKHAMVVAVTSLLGIRQ